MLAVSNHFFSFAVAPMIWVQNQLEYGVIGQNVTLHCNTESYPPAIHFWRLQNGTAISSGALEYICISLFASYLMK